MKNIKSTLLILLATSACYGANAAEAIISGSPRNHLIYQQDPISNELFLRQVMLYSLKQKQLSGLVAEHSANAEIKLLANNTLNLFSASNDELLRLAKSKNISLTNTTLPGALRPDGRVDSAPENLKDTSRTQNQGEAGNTGQPKVKMAYGFTAINDSDILKSLNELKSLKSNGFDPKYLSEVAQDHENLIEIFNLGKKSTDRDIRKFSAKYLSKFKANLAKVKALTR